MTSTGKLAGALCLALCCSWPFSISAQTITHNIGDDGYASVPLQFEFPLYGQIFTHSWMYDNGVIGFQDPAQGGYIGLSVQPFSVNMGSRYNYAIYPLWTDLINIVGSHTTQGSGAFQRYNWISVSPFYDSTRINTFSVEIRPDGQIIANYSLISVDYASVGVTGDVSRGEFEQIGFYQTPITADSVSNWERYTVGQDPCSGVQGCGASSPVPSPTLTTTTPWVEITESSTGVEATALTPAPAMLGSGVSVASVLSMIARDSARIAVLEKSVMESSQEQADIANANLQDLDSAAAQVASGRDSATLGSSANTNTVSVAGFSAVDLLADTAKSTSGDASQEQKTSAVRPNSPDNDLAGGISLAALAVQPPGFAAYSVTMPDVAFYAARDIYRDQHTVDNARALRALSSDRLHQDMVNQQYRR
jgi:hypothetical protein